MIYNVLSDTYKPINSNMNEILYLLYNIVCHII